jgi:hypothetical protein
MIFVNSLLKINISKYIRISNDGDDKENSG